MKIDRTLFYWRHEKESEVWCVKIWCEHRVQSSTVKLKSFIGTQQNANSHSTCLINETFNFNLFSQHDFFTCLKSLSTLIRLMIALHTCEQNFSSLLSHAVFTVYAMICLLFTFHRRDAHCISLEAQQSAWYCEVVWSHIRLKIIQKSFTNIFLHSHRCPRECERFSLSVSRSLSRVRSHKSF